MSEVLLVVGGKAGAQLVSAFSEHSKLAVYDVHCAPKEEWEIVGSFVDAVSLIKDGADYFIATGDNKVRQDHFNRLSQASGKAPCNVVHRTAVVEDEVRLGAGVLICPGAIININATICDGAIINTSAIIEHDCFCDVFSQVSPGATLTGNCRIGKRAFIGAGGVLLPNTSVGDDTVVGAGAVVTKNLAANLIVKGIPAK